MTFRSQRVRALVATLDALSPLGVLARGYSIVSTSPEGRVITRASDVAMNDEIGIRLGQGRLVCGVRRVLTDSS
jgi:exodeoxyribonuclease VII large subunit